MSKSLKHKIRQVFKNNEVVRLGHDRDIDLDDEDIEFIVQQVWNMRCAVTTRRFGGHIILTLTRWDILQPPTPYNLVLMMQDEAIKFANNGKSIFDETISTKIEERLAWAKRVYTNQILPYDFGPVQIYWDKDHPLYHEKKVSSSQTREQLGKGSQQLIGRRLINRKTGGFGNDNKWSFIQGLVSGSIIVAGTIGIFSAFS
jgi:hypothetical protein